MFFRYDEIKHHPFGSEPKTLSSGHFSQVLWMASRQLGVAFAKSNSRIIVVANYLPPGNIIGQFKENVPPPGGFQAHLVNTDTVNKISSELANSSISSNAKKTMTRGTNSEFEDDFLTAHNKYRSRHGVTALKLDKKLCSYSTEWAKILASKNHLEHRKTSPYGRFFVFIF